MCVRVVSAAPTGDIYAYDFTRTAAWTCVCMRALTSRGANRIKEGMSLLGFRALVRLGVSCQTTLQRDASMGPQGQVCSTRAPYPDQWSLAPSRTGSLCLSPRLDEYLP